MQHHTFQCRHAIGRQFHQIDFAIAFEDRFSHKERGDQCHNDPDDINQPEGERLIFFRKKCGDQQCIDRQTGSAAHQRQDHDRDFAVAFRFNGARCHDRRNGTAESQHQRHKGSALQTENTHDPVHDIRGTGHITGIFQQRNGKEQEQDIGQKHHHAADATDDPVDHHIPQERQRFFIPVSADEFTQPGESVFDVSHERICERECEPECEIHNDQKDGQPQKFIGHNAVDLIGDLPAFFLCECDGIAAGTGKHGITAVRHKCIGIDGVNIPQMADLRGNFAVHRFEFRNTHGGSIVFQQFDRKETGGNMGILFDIQSIDLFRDRANGVVHIRTVCEHGHPVIVQHLQERSQTRQQRTHAAGFAADGLNDGRTEVFFQFGNIKFQPFFLGIIGHIECQQHGDMQFRQLGGQIKTALGNGGVDHVDDQIDPRSRQLLKHNFFFRRTGRKRIHTRQVHKFNINAIQREAAAFTFHCHAGIVPHVLTRSRQCIKNTGFPAVGISCKSYTIFLFHFFLPFSSLITILAASSL